MNPGDQYGQQPHYVAPETPGDPSFLPPDQPRRAPGLRLKPLWVGVSAAVVVFVAFLAVVISHAGRHETESASDFKHWIAFGGVDEQVSNGGRSVLIDTHDTTATWSTKWSGLIYRDRTACAAEISGRIRDVSHSPGNPGGVGIGLASLTATTPGQDQLNGLAVQFDYGFRGYRVTEYPSDNHLSVTSAPLDNLWHTFDVRFDGQGLYQMAVDGAPAVSAQGARLCGSPVVRVWAGAAEIDAVAVKFGD